MMPATTTAPPAARHLDLASVSSKVKAAMAQATRAGKVLRRVQRVAAAGAQAGVAVRAAVVKGARPQKSGWLDLSSKERPPDSMSPSKTSLTRRGYRYSTYCSVGRASTMPVATKLAPCLSRTRPSTRPTTLCNAQSEQTSSQRSAIAVQLGSRAVLEAFALLVQVS